MDNSNLNSKLYSTTNDLRNNLNDFAKSNSYFIHDHFTCTCVYSKNYKKWCINIVLGTCHWFIDCSNFEFKGKPSNKISFPTYYRGVIDVYLEIFKNIFKEENKNE